MVVKKKTADDYGSAESRRLRRTKRKKRKRVLLSLMLMLMICIGILFTPVFNLSEIEINGNEKIKSADLIKSSGLIMGENIFKFKLNEVGEKVSAIPYVNSVFIERKLPGKVSITLTESIPVAYAPYSDTLLVLDKDGKVLETKTDKVTYALPVLKDFQITKFALGKKISVKDEENLKKTLEITKNLYNNNLMEKISAVTCENGQYYLIVNENLKVIIGEAENLSGKFIMLKEVFGKIPQDATGIIDARNPDKVYHRS